MSKIISSLIPDKILEKIGKIAEKPINQNEKIEKLEKLLNDCKLKVLDCGTNRIVFRCKDYPTVVFKVSMDEQGILDNLNEYEKSDKSPRFPSSLDVDENGYVLVQKKWTIIDADEFEDKEVKRSVRKCLEELEDEFLLIDLGMDKRKNFAYDENGKIGVIDFGYVTYKEFGNFNCPISRKSFDGKKTDHCKGHLIYNKNYNMVQCDECDNLFKVDVLIEGHCEHKYENTKQNKEAFVVTSELKEFYESFNTYRDKESLRKYVKINTDGNKQNTMINKGGNNPMNEKDKFMSIFNKSTKAADEVKPVIVEKQNIPKPDESIGEHRFQAIKELAKTPHSFSSVMGNEIPSTITSTGKSVYTKLDNGVDSIYPDADNNADIDKNDSENYDRQDSHATYFDKCLGKNSEDEDLLHNKSAISEEDYETDIVNIRVNTINNMLPEGEDGDEIISRLFYERFPGAQDKMESSSGIRTAFNDYVTIEAGTGNEVNIDIDMDNAEIDARPVIILHKDDMIVTIDLTKQLEYLIPALRNNLHAQGDDENLAIITYMYGESFEKFDGKYQSRYESTDE